MVTLEPHTSPRLLFGCPKETATACYREFQALVYWSTHYCLLWVYLLISAAMVANQLTEKAIPIANLDRGQR